jgi:KaiC/GvpD/RAD55 family RecA-like ATPase
MQAEVAGFKVQIPGLADYTFPSGTLILLTGKPGIGKSAFAKQFCLEGLKARERVIAALTDTTASKFREQVRFEGSELDVVDFLLEKPAGVHEISARVQELIARPSSRPIRLIFDSLSTVGTMFNPGLLAPWLLDLRAALLRQHVRVLALVNYATGINPPSITRSLHPFADIILEMRLEESREEHERQLRVFVARGVSHSADWIPFTVTDMGVEFGRVPSAKDEMEQILLKVDRNIPGHHRLFATVLFMDIATPRKQASAPGVRGLEEEAGDGLDLSRKEVERSHGRVVLTTERGMLAVFDRAEDAVHCALRVRDDAHARNLEIRGGLHTGEVQLLGKNIAGVAVHIAVRVASRAAPGEMLISSTVKDAVAREGIHFTDRGLNTLEGISGEWHLFALP